MIDKPKLKLSKRALLQMMAMTQTMAVTPIPFAVRMAAEAEEETLREKVENERVTS